jgi:TolA-binding protein
MEFKGTPQPEYRNLAKQACQAFLTDYPNEPQVDQALSLLYVLYREDGQEQESRNLQAYAEKLTAPSAQQWLATVSYFQGTPEGYQQAATRWQQLAATAPKDPQRALWLYRAGRSLALLKKMDDAVKVYKQVVQEYPETNYAVQAKAGMALLKGAN